MRPLARIPVVSVEAVAPESGSFSIGGAHFKRLLHQLDPQVGALCQRRKLSAPSADYAVEQAIHYRKPVAVMIDEAQHLCKIPQDVAFWINST